MELTDINKLTTAELTAALETQRAELQKLRFDVATMKETKVHKVAALKKTIARMNTVLAERMKEEATK